MMLSKETLDAIRARCAKATPGPWRWTHSEWNEAKYLRPGQSPTGRRVARVGRSLRDSWVMLLQGSARHNLDAIQSKTIPEIVESRRADEHDFNQILGFRWHAVKSGYFVGSPKEEDQDFIGAAREDIPLLLAALEEAYAKIDRLMTEGTLGHERG